MGKTPLTAAQEILLAAADLSPDGTREFSEWDLTVTAWKRNKNRFGCRGYEDEYPDHKRTMMEIMGTTKRDNPLRRGWMEKTRTNHYRITKLGLAEAEMLRRLTGEALPSTPRSPQNVYDAIERYVFHRAFLAHCKDPEEPRTWLGASAFFGLTSNNPTVLKDKVNGAQETIGRALRWFDEEKTDLLRRGPTGGKATIHQDDVRKLKVFVSLLQERFKVQIEAINRQGADAKKITS